MERKKQQEVTGVIGENGITTTLVIQEKEFVNRGQVIRYLSCEAEVFGQKIKFEASDNDKRLLKYLLEVNGILTPKDEEDVEGGEE